MVMVFQGYLISETLLYIITIFLCGIVYEFMCGSFVKKPNVSRKKILLILQSQLTKQMMIYFLLCKVKNGERNLSGSVNLLEWIWTEWD